ncbi:protein GLE1 [Cucumis melo var. makuwa]|uniref:Protein GLE1 n=1 Tax=Cucumis melo var. makuwa TaxID=1194695 RepID=A0A5A7T607_CUCMM|nr:protein GLE1 [Cucumis melo var. makuwa]
MQWSKRVAGRNITDWYKSKVGLLEIKYNSSLDSLIPVLYQSTTFLRDGTMQVYKKKYGIKRLKVLGAKEFTGVKPEIGGGSITGWEELKREEIKHIHGCYIGSFLSQSLKLFKVCSLILWQVTVDPHPDFSFDDFRVKLRSLEEKLNKSTMPFKKTCSRDFPVTKTLKRSSKPFIMGVYEDELKEIFNNEVVRDPSSNANRFNCDGILLR